MPSQDRTQTLVLDTAPLLTSTLSSLLVFSNKFITTPDVIEEVRGKGQRERLQREWNTLDSTLANNPGGSNVESHQWQGLQVREPSVAGISKVKEFARQTGDLAVLSTTDIRVLALAYDIEVEANGTWRLRDKVGGKRMGKDPEKAQARLLRKQAKSTADPIVNETTHQPELPGDLDQLSQSTKDLTLRELTTASAILDDQRSDDDVDDHEDTLNEAPTIAPTDESTDADWTQVPIKSTPDAIHENDEEDCSDSSSVASESDPTWITPENVHLHKAKDMGFFPSLTPKPTTPSDADPDHITSQPTEDTEAVPKHKVDGSNAGGGPSSATPTMKAALLTGDYAMQNVALQIGLNVFGIGGKRIRDVKTWVLRCYGCFKLCKDPIRKFCPTCGGATLTRVSITYTPSTPSGYILHLKSNFQYRNRGTIYAIPSAKPGSASFEKGAKAKANVVNGASLILREDQKEYQRGLKSLGIQKAKEERKLAKAQQERAGKSDAFVFGGAAGWDDPDWEAPMLMGERGRKTGGRQAVAKGVQYGKDGLPVIGFGKNPNEVRRRR
ncbi:hypothetical protein CROQUDRAFT_669510 [Cronartium quercuum f. sp. fusiforme G11]|uniref:20S-pre-rRNA D-site endonuclease NOB1 n=1 Tax=Cronartium quercuum f. sp. fusiforme G11 TaxID=708437 RepID=A0A9P6NL32_9BASI|nr:hypothetical protein CROQUDRAFT_669510 [Cronartium quercuum f. sp. fusiforme G11]